jgi:SAM-dependent methyltransferase
VTEPAPAGSPRQALDQAIFEFKRNYWTKPGIGPEYHHYALEPAPITRAKNLVEFGLVLSHVLGPRVLDAGAGTGRITSTLRNSGHRAISLDYSMEMLRTAAVAASKHGAHAPSIQGDVFKLPFADNAFDSVVSMTVLRHFPQWREILAEYLRVVRPGGRVVFDAASGDQESFIRRQFGKSPPTNDPMHYNAPVALMDMYAIAGKLGVSIHWMGPYDFFNENELLKRIHGENYNGFLAELKSLLSSDEAIAVYFMLSRHVFCRVSPACSSSWFIVLTKGQTQSGPPQWPTFSRVFEPKSIEEVVQAIWADQPTRSRDLVDSIQALRTVSGTSSLLGFLDAEFVAKMPSTSWNWALPA